MKYAHKYTSQDIRALALTSTKQIQRFKSFCIQLRLRSNRYYFQKFDQEKETDRSIGRGRKREAHNFVYKAY